MSKYYSWLPDASVYDIYNPYQEISYEGIKYTTCREYDHISRYKGLRQVIHNPNTSDIRFISTETMNAIKSNTDVEYYEVPSDLENRLDIIAHRKLGSAQYSWVICYFNNIQDGFTCYQGQILTIPKSISVLFNSGEILSMISPIKLNLGSE